MIRMVKGTINRHVYLFARLKRVFTCSVVEESSFEKAGRRAVVIDTGITASKTMKFDAALKLPMAASEEKKASITCWYIGRIPVRRVDA